MLTCLCWFKNQNLTIKSFKNIDEHCQYKQWFQMATLAVMFVMYSSSQYHHSQVVCST